MKLSTAVTIFVLVTTPFIAIPVVQPFWNDYKQAVQDCADTKPEQRTAKQQESCKPRGPAGLIIPGIL